MPGTGFTTCFISLTLGLFDGRQHQQEVRYDIVPDIERWPRSIGQVGCGNKVESLHGYKLMAPIGKCEVLVLDDLLISPLTTEDQHELLEIAEERYDRKATIVTSQLPIKAWYNAMQDPTLADAILDRLVHNAYKLELKGESMRRKRSSLDRKTEAVTE